MELHYLRVSMKIFTNLFADEKLTREAWLKEYLSAERRFLHANNEFIFKPEPASPQFPHILFGWIARERLIRERTPPNEGLEPTEHPSWQAAFVMVDTSAHEDGQKIVMEHNSSIGKPLAIWKSLIKSMNRMPMAPYSGEVFSIVEEGSFWSFAKAHKDRIKSITLDVATPNMFDDVNDFQEEMRSLRDNENVARVKTMLESDTVLNHQTSRLSSIVDYTERGAGTLTAVSEDGEVYNSEAHSKRVIIDIEPHSKNVDEFLRQIITLLAKII
jgi:hypothetical protein